MTYIQNLTKNFIRDNVIGFLTNSTSIVSAAKRDVGEIYNTNDKITFLTAVIDACNKEHESHNANPCRNPDCPYDDAILYVSYHLNQELEQLGFKVNEDTFTPEDKAIAEDKIEQIINELQTIKDSQQIIYDELVKEFSELKELIYLGKKKWHNTLLGTGVNMAASGVVSEATAKPILNIITKDIVNPFIDVIKDNFSQLT